MFTLEVNIDGLERKMETLAENANDLKKPLRQFGGYLRKKAVAKYKAQGFAPLATSTISHRAQKGLHSVQRKLESELKSSIKKAAGPPAPRGILGILSRFLFGGGANMTGSIVGSQSKAAQRKLAVLNEFKQKHGRSQLANNGSRLSLKQQASLAGREMKAVAKAVHGPILGKLASSLVVTVNRGSVTLTSRTKGQWSDVHNEGGAAGHGAKIPQRETIKLEAEDLDVFAQILREHHLAAFE